MIFVVFFKTTTMYFLTTTETTGTTRRTDANAGCHEVTYNRDNKITIADSAATSCFSKTTRFLLPTEELLLLSLSLLSRPGKRQDCQHVKIE